MLFLVYRQLSDNAHYLIYNTYSISLLEPHHAVEGVAHKKDGQLLTAMCQFLNVHSLDGLGVGNTEDEVVGYRTEISGMTVTNTWVPKENPPTGDNFIYYASAMLASAVAGFVIWKRRRRYSY